MALEESLVAADEAVARLKKQMESNPANTTGLPPQNMTLFTAQVGDQKVTLKFSVPAETVIDGQLVCTTAGVMIRRKEGAYPESVTDGDLVVNTTDLTATVVDSGLENDTTYYYRAFPYSDHGVYNFNEKNTASATPVAYILYGFKINKNDSNPKTRITYTEGAVGKTPAKMNYTTGVFDYGDWADAWFVQGNRPYMIKSDGSVGEELNPNDYSKTADGGASHASDASYDGNAMASFPLMWFKRWEEGSYEYVNVCNVQLDETYHAYAHTRKDGSIMDVKYLSMFEGAYISGKMRSLSGQTVGVGQTAATEITYATANGERWYTEAFSDIEMVRDLLYLIGCSDDTQTTFGYGVGSASAAIKTGMAAARGQFYGTAASGVMKVFHIENFWGNVWNRIAGLVNANGKIKYKTTAPYSLDGADYIDTGLVPAGTSGGYVNLTKMTDGGRIGYTASGSATTYACDGLWFANNQNNYAMFGGGWNDAALLGALCVNLTDAASSAGTGVGARLSCEQPAA